MMKFPPKTFEGCMAGTVTVNDAKEETSWDCDINLVII
jgi:hypothetical protein